MIRLNAASLFHQLTDMRKTRTNATVRRALAELLNIVNEPKGYESASTFIERYEPLRPESSMPEADAVEYARRLRDIWAAKRKDEIEQANASLDELFRAGDPIKKEGPAVRADLVGRKIKPTARTLLHALALELLYFPKSIGKCAWCGKFFVKDESRDKFCPPKFKDGANVRDCKHEYRNNYQAKLMAKRRRDAERSDRKNQ